MSEASIALFLPLMRCFNIGFKWNRKFKDRDSLPTFVYKADVWLLVCRYYGRRDCTPVDGLPLDVGIHSGCAERGLGLDAMNNGMYDIIVAPTEAVKHAFTVIKNMM